MLGSFLFTGDDVHKPAGVLSGGEKTRLALAMIVVSGANVLLLDEPTNNLDPASREEILGALAHYEGAVVLVSHDEGAVEALNPERVLILPDGVEDHWSRDYQDLDRARRDLPPVEHLVLEVGVGVGLLALRAPLRSRGRRGLVHRSGCLREPAPLLVRGPAEPDEPEQREDEPLQRVREVRVPRRAPGGPRRAAARRRRRRSATSSPYAPV